MDVVAYSKYTLVTMSGGGGCPVMFFGFFVFIALSVDVVCGGRKIN